MSNESLVNGTPENFVNLLNNNLDQECRDIVIEYGIPLAHTCLQSDHIDIKKTEGLCKTECKNIMANFINHVVPKCGNQQLFTHIDKETAADFISHVYFTSAVGCVWVSTSTHRSKRVIGPSTTDNLSCLLIQTGSVLKVAGDIDLSNTNNAVITSVNLAAQLSDSGCSICVDNQVQALNNIQPGILSPQDQEASDGLNQFFNSFCQPIGTQSQQIADAERNTPYQVTGAMLGIIGNVATGNMVKTGRLVAAGDICNSPLLFVNLVWCTIVFLL